MVLDGFTDQAIADAVGVNRASVTRFRQRNQIQLEELRQNQDRALEDFYISRKAWRIQKLEEMASGLDAELSTDGYTYREPTRHGERIHAHPAAQELRATLKQAAEELDQLPRAGVTVNNQNVVIVKQVTSGGEGNPEL